MKRTKIVCTIGPSSESEEVLRELILAGMNVARFNFSHGSHEEHKRKQDRVMKLNEELETHVATLMDTKGPEIRLKDFENSRVELKEGQKFILTTENIMGTNEKVSISYKNLKNDIKVGNIVLIDDGLIKMIVEEITETNIVCKVLNGGFVSDKKGVNVPGANLSMPYINDVDREDIMFGCEAGFDYLAASFVRCKKDVLEIKKIISETNSNMKIISKIENMQGIHNLKEILEVSDGIMVARGDMGVEVPMEDVPSIQKRMIKLAVAQGKQVITATQMLESMVNNPRPTRAEVTDVANAIYDGTTAIMLSGETASGMYPIEAVKTMARIAQRTEKEIDYDARMKRCEVTENMDTTTAISQATCTIAISLNAAVIVTVTISGNTARMISRYKPSCPIIAFAIDEQVCRQLNLVWGVYPLLIKRENNMEELFLDAIREMIKHGYINKGEKLVLTTGVPLGIPGNTNMIRVIEL